MLVSCCIAWLWPFDHLVSKEPAEVLTFDFNVPEEEAAGMILLVSAESYATPIRGTYYGISAAIGKAGAAIGVQAFAPIQKHLGAKWSFIIAAIGSFTGVLVTYFFVPDMTGVDLADEDARFMEYLEINGWEGVVGEDEDRDLL
ncbi:hypothetical protein EDB84DRAFT_1556401 [Lactarius hengduanensis]|nr:hypothetical protein EDB84DRAFT_1556401 [Lactarius hengduanensis]